VEFLAKRRTKYEIYEELLDIVARRGYCRLTRASYGANLPVDRAKKSLTFLASRGFVKEESVDDSKIYRITKRGLEYLETFKQMRKLFAALDEKILPAHARIQAKLNLRVKEAKIGEDVNLEIELVNTGNAPAFLTKIENFLPAGFELVKKPDYYNLKNADLVLKRKELDPIKTEEIQITLKSLDTGTFLMKPKITYVDGAGRRLSCEPEPVTINILESVTGHISTGYRDLDSLLLGGIPEDYGVILTSISCDEKDLLIKRFLEAGVKEGQVTFYVTIELSGVRKLAEEFQSNFYIFICNPQADTIIESLPNVFKLKGVENLTDINIALTSAFRKLDASLREPRRACIEIISDVLLQHHAVQTRRWLTGLIPELRSKRFTTLTVMNPQMHPPEEVQAILDLFEGEITIYEKRTKKGLEKFLRIKKMYNQKYIESEMSLIKKKLQT
jgi:uncharacterized repeat protein (TIGR01451 family)